MAALTRRRFAQLLALSPTAALLPRPAYAFDDLGVSAAPLRPTPASPDEKFWLEVRSRYLLPRDVAFLNVNGPDRLHGPAGQDRPGLRVAPHLYNTMDEMDRTVGAIRKYLATGV